jgi:hypothetical protein
MDYMSCFPSNKHGNDFVFVVVNPFSKILIFSLFNKIITTEATTKIFFESVWVYFGLLYTIISGRDSSFLSTF